MSVIIKPCDVSEMLKHISPEIDLIVDGIHLGRGETFTETSNVRIWKIIDESLEQLPKTSPMIFLDYHTYIIQCSFKTATQNNTLVFYWKGSNAPKGYSPLPEDIEEENPPVERVVQWAEPPAFLRLFNGTLIVRNTVGNEPCLYMVKGEIPEEIHFFGVPLEWASLRSRASFLLLDPLHNIGMIWKGKLNNTNIKNYAAKCFHSDFIEMEEGSETVEFLELIKGKREDYFDSSREINHTPRLFYFNSITGNFLATEIESNQKSPNHESPFPFLQSHLSSALEPALFLLDDDEEVWFWQNGDDDTIQFREECEAAKVTVLDYAKSKRERINKPVKVYKIKAGEEGTDFTNLFPTWIRTDVPKLSKHEWIQLID